MPATFAHKKRKGCWSKVSGLEATAFITSPSKSVAKTQEARSCEIIVIRTGKAAAEICHIVESSFLDGVFDDRYELVAKLSWGF